MELLEIFLSVAKRLYSRGRRLYQSSGVYGRNLNLKIKDFDKLHLGCGHHRLCGWFNTDYFPKDKKVYHLDATKKIPIQNEVFAFCFTEHMIEHISLRNAEFFIAELYRVLKPGGVLRISTPDFDFLINLYQGELGELGEKYMKWSYDNFLTEEFKPKPIYIFNNFVRDWGHLFIYNFDSLKNILEEAGFKKIYRVEVGQSAYPELANVENVSRMPRDFLQLESLVLEAVKY